MNKSTYLFSVIILLCTLVSTISQAQTKTIFLVRHAEKADDLKGDRDPELNEIGLSRSEKLADMLSEADVDFIFSTDFKRSTATGQPLAVSRGKTVSIYDPRDPEALNKILAESGSRNILIIGHSNTTPMMVNQLLGEEKYSFLDETDYDKLFIVTIFEDSSNCIILKY